MTDAPERFSYAAPDDALLKRFVIQLIERMTGQPRLKRLYDAYRAAPMPEDIWQDALQRLQLTLVFDAAPLDSWPRAGPLVVICNHPFGVVDGLAICTLTSRIRPDFRILTNALLTQPSAMRRHMLPVDFSGTAAATRTNLHSRAEARAHLVQGGCLIVFPAGGVSTTPSLWHRRATDAAWGGLTAKLIAQSGASVAPVYFPGQNSRLFQIASHLHLTLRLALLFKEAHDRIGSTVRLYPGRAVPAADLPRLDDRALMDHLRRVTYGLAPKS